MRSDTEQSLYIEFEELFALRERLRTVADQVRTQLLLAGLRERLAADVFDQELELRAEEGSNLLIRLDSLRLEVTGARPELRLHHLAGLILSEAEAFRLTAVEVGFVSWYKVGPLMPLNLVAQAFASSGPGLAGEVMLDRRFAMTWDWSSATTGYSFQASVAEDRELMLSFKAREGYMTLPELQTGMWMDEQRTRFEQASALFLGQLGWQQ